MLILAIESSCDETACAVVEMGEGERRILSNSVATQIATHALYGGVVPEIASRAHVEAISSITYEALDKAGVSLDEIGETKTRIRTYEDCIEILNKEFFELSILDEIGIEEYIKKTRDKIVNKLCPVGNHNRGTQDYIRNLKQANMIAEIIEALCYQMVNYGYNLKH